MTRVPHGLAIIIPPRFLLLLIQASARLARNPELGLRLKISVPLKIENLQHKIEEKPSKVLENMHFYFFRLIANIRGAPTRMQSPTDTTHHLIKHAFLIEISMHFQVSTQSTKGKYLILSCIGDVRKPHIRGTRTSADTT